MMLLEHEEGRGLLRAMRQQEDRKTAVAIRQYARLLRAHIDKENGILFPLADAVLDDQAVRTLSREFAAVEAEQGKTASIAWAEAAVERLIAALDEAR